MKLKPFETSSALNVKQQLLVSPSSSNEEKQQSWLHSSAV